MQGRHELKHNINYMDYRILKSRLKAVLSHDENTGNGGIYKVRSIYFDSPSDKVLREKLDGINHREKFRIRRYGNNSIIRVEKKSKYNGICYKESEIITEEEYELIAKGNYAFMLNENRPLLTEFYSKIKTDRLSPKTIVDYDREPFVCKAGNVRITFDMNIKTGLLNTDFLNDFIPTISAGDGLVILEVKYDHFLPEYLVGLLNSSSQQARAFSKYAVCRMYG